MGKAQIFGYGKAFGYSFFGKAHVLESGVDGEAHFNVFKASSGDKFGAADDTSIVLFDDGPYGRECFKNIL